MHRIWDTSAEHKVLTNKKQETMQNAQNTEIQQRVMNLVNLYRIKVGKESEVAKEAKEDYDFWEEANSRFAEEDFANGESVSFGVYGTGSHTGIWKNHLMVNEQLIGHFYAKVAGPKSTCTISSRIVRYVHLF